MKPSKLTDWEGQYDALQLKLRELEREQRRSLEKVRATAAYQEKQALNKQIRECRKLAEQRRLMIEGARDMLAELGVSTTESESTPTTKSKITAIA